MGSWHWVHWAAAVEAVILVGVVTVATLWARYLRQVIGRALAIVDGPAVWSQSVVPSTPPGGTATPETVAAEVVSGLPATTTSLPGENTRLRHELAERHQQVRTEALSYEPVTGLPRTLSGRQRRAVGELASCRP